MRRSCEGGALVVVIGGQEGARVRAHGADALQHIHRFRSPIQVDHAQDDVLDIAAEGVAQDDQLHQRQHQRGEEQRRAAAELAHVALDQGQSSLHRGPPFFRSAGGNGGFGHLRQPVAGVMQEYVVQAGGLHRQAFQLELVLARQLDQLLRRSRAAVARDAIGGRAQRAHRLDRRQRLQVGGAVGQIGLELQLDAAGAGHRGFQRHRRVQRHDAAAVDDRDPVAEAVGLVHVMRGEKERAALLGAQMRDHLPHRNARGRVEAGGGLVQKQDLRVVHQAARDLEAPPHAPRQRGGKGVGAVGEADGFEQLRRALAAPRPGDAVQPGVNAHILGAGELGVAGHVLRNDPDAGAHRVGVANDIVPGHDRRAAGGRHQRRQHADERALARAVRSEQAEDLAALDREADVIHRQQRAKALADAFDLDRDAVWGLALRFHDG